MANKEEKAEGKESGWKDFFYNPRTGEFLGRTASSWGKKHLFLEAFGVTVSIYTADLKPVMDQITRCVISALSTHAPLITIIMKRN